MKHYGKRIHAFNCPKLQRTILTLVSIMFVCLYVCDYDCLSFFLIQCS